MTLDLRLETLYRQVELVAGIGDPRRGKLCIMSFVALLAGESHSDSPAAASPLIRCLAIPVNDRMPAALRQRLKPFAPRMIGTHDRLDGARAEMLASALREEIAPRMREDFRMPARRLGFASEICAAARALEIRLAALADDPATFADPAAQREVASVTAHILALCARTASRPQIADWYWNKAVDLLDRLCGVRDEAVTSRLDMVRVAWLEGVLARRERLRQRAAVASRAMGRLRRLLPLRIDAG